MLTGPQALSSLNEALKDIRSEENDIAARVNRLTARLAKMREEETADYASLAQLRLDDIAGKEITATLNKGEKRARALLSTHSTKVEKLADKITTLEEILDTHEAKRETSAKKLGTVSDKLDKLTDTVSDQILKNDKIAAQRAVAEGAGNKAERAFEKTGLAEQDRAEKGDPYRADPLFMYLWTRNYASSKYEAGNITRMLDNWIARKVGYIDARANYAMLNEIPDRLSEHAERLKNLANEAFEKLYDLERQIIDAAGGKKLRNDMAALRGEIAKIDETLFNAEESRALLVTARTDLVEGQDPAYSEAIEILVASLRAEPIRELYKLAAETPTPDDEKIVAKLDELNRRERDEQAQAKEDRARLDVLGQRRKELEDIQWEFKQKHFDDPTSGFSRNDLVEDLLTEFLRGAISAGSYWDSWNSSQSWKKRKRPRLGGAIGFPSDIEDIWQAPTDKSRTRSPWTRGPVSTGSMSGRSRSSGKSNGRGKGSRKHKGFRTGGGF